ncbi:DUF4131 domain-containing protein [Billgrantia gudaonensis]|uniref:DUF4131 domain-containing protein n=1 Tax=Billgrantia gudaonensis TaxID=376427 RepID=A0A432JK34_9GAMM|nr:DUF4131 domain-containing protein [Halomonas gudaonensis]
MRRHPLQPGERWALTVPAPAEQFRQSGKPDYRAWLWREGVHATGYVRRDPAPRRLVTASASLSSALWSSWSRRPCRRWVRAGWRR